MARRGEYGVVKALGGSNFDLYRVVAWQALLSVALGYAIGAAGSLALAAGVPLIQPLLAFVVTPASLLTNAAVALVIAILAALLPIRQISGLDPTVKCEQRWPSLRSSP